MPSRRNEVFAAAVPVAFAAALLAVSPEAASAVVQSVPVASATPWWTWPLALFLTTFLIGIVAVLAGIGGGVLFVPIVGGFFPFHLDFVRSASLLVALAGALSAASGLLTNRMANLRLAMPFALVGSVFSVLGALLSFSLPTQVLEVMLGATIMAVVVLMLRAKKDGGRTGGGDEIAMALGLAGVYFDHAEGRDIDWQVRNTIPGLVAFGAIGLVGGMFGLGAGWANVPALNLLLGVPLKGAVATSNIVMSIVNTSAAWIYITRGAVLPMLVVPSLIGVMLGARIGARLLSHLSSLVIHRFVVAVLVLAGLRALLKGLGLWS